jgi:hypothetical protein
MTKRTTTIIGSTEPQLWIKVEGRAVWKQLSRHVNAKEERIKVEYWHVGQQRFFGSNTCSRTARRKLEKLVIVLFVVNEARKTRHRPLRSKRSHSLKASKRKLHLSGPLVSNLISPCSVARHLLAPSSTLPLTMILARSL